jgi:hypothetical protein
MILSEKSEHPEPPFGRLAVFAPAKARLARTLKFPNFPVCQPRLGNRSRVEPQASDKEQRAPAPNPPPSDLKAPGIQPLTRRDASKPSAGSRPGSEAPSRHRQRPVRPANVAELALLAYDLSSPGGCDRSLGRTRNQPKGR